MANINNKNQQKTKEKASMNENAKEKNSDRSLDVISTPWSLRDEYCFVKELGHGAQAKVFQAIRLSDGKNVTIKQLNIASVKNWKEYELFHREAEILCKLQIPGVAAFYEARECLDDEPPCSYIVQEFIEGESLAKMLKDGYRFKVSDIYDIILQMLKILQQLQSCKEPVIHRDIKPSNMMISPNPNGSFRVTLIDFGAVANPQVQGGGSTVAGTFGFMPPEQLMGNPVPASDIYSLAAVAVQLFTYQSPADLPSKDFRLIFEPYMEQMPPELIATLRSMLEPKVVDRLSDISQLIDRFEAFKKNSFKQYGAGIQSDSGMEAFGDKLKDVRTIGESGNIDLWQALSDQTPRGLPSILCQKDKFSEYIKAHRRPDGHLKNKAGLFGFFMLVILFAGLAMAASESENDGVRIIIIFSLFIVFLLMSVCLSQVSKVSKGTVHKDMMSPDFFAILESGRKTIATITEVSYLPVKECIKFHNLFVCSELPSFLIRYRFNPPDDSSGTRDLIHRCIVHEAPEGHYQVGDPLPILYDLNNHYFDEHINSLPFPFSLNDFEENELVDFEVVYKKNDKSKLDWLYGKYFAPVFNSSKDYDELLYRLKDVRFFDESLKENNDLKRDCYDFLVGLFKRKDNMIEYYCMYQLSIVEDLRIGKGLFYDFVLSYLDGDMTLGGLTGLLSSSYPVGFYEELEDKIEEVFMSHIDSYLVNPIVQRYCERIKHHLDDIGKRYKTFLINYFKKLERSQLQPSVYVVNALLCVSDYFRGYLMDNCLDIWDAMIQCLKSSSCNERMIQILIETKKHPFYIQQELHVDMLEDPQYAWIHSLIANFLYCDKSPELLNYLKKSLSNHTLSLHVIMGIAFVSRSTWFDSSPFNDYFIEIYRLMLDAFKDDAISSSFRFMMMGPDWSKYRKYISRMPMQLVNEIFDDAALKSYYPSVYRAVDERENFNSQVLDSMDYYFKRNLKKDVYLHIRVLSALWCKIRCHYDNDDAWSKSEKNRFNAICRDIYRRGGQELKEFINDEIKKSIEDDGLKFDL